MRLREVAFRGITRFTGEEPVRIDYGRFGRGLVALVGENGAGKTSAMEAVPAALYRRFPSRPGSIYDHAHGRDAFIEAAFEDDGREVRVRLLIDAERRTVEGYVLEDGQPVTDGKAAAFEEAIVRRFGSMELFLASVFAAQNKAGNFLLKKKGERKALFVELLGLGHLDRLAAGAREKASTLRAELDRQRGVLRELEEMAGDLEALEQEAKEADEEVAQASAALARAKQAEEEAREKALDAERVAERLRAAEAGLKDAEREVSRAEQALREALTEPEKLQEVARRQLAVVEAALDAGPRKQQAMERLQQVLDRVEARKRELQEILAEADRVEQAERMLEVVRGNLAEIEELATKLREAEEASRLWEVRIHDLEARLKREQAAREERLADLRRRTKLLDEVPCGEVLAAKCPLLAEARTAAQLLARLEAEEHPFAAVEAELEAVRKEWKAAFREHLEIYQSLEDTNEDSLRKEEERLRQIVAKAPRIEAARSEMDALEREVRRAREQYELDLKQAERDAEKAAAEKQRIEQALQADLERARERIREAERAFDEATRRRNEAREVLAGLRDAWAAAGADQARQRVLEAQAARERADDVLRHAMQRQAAVRVKLSRARETATKAETVREAIASIEEDLGDWSLLERALGKDGVQALEVDAAGPEVARLTNELLESCYGPRFSVTFETLREKKSRPGEFSEVFDVKVFDRGQERPVEALSGGEKVIVGEAINLALAIFNARKSGVRWRTLWRDETAGALDPENASRYIAMLRRAMDLGGFDQVIFVAHLPEVWEQADAKVFFRDGRVEVAA